MMLKPNNVNLYAKYTANPERDAKRRSSIIKSVPVVVIIMVIAGAAGWLYSIVSTLSEQVKNYMSQVEELDDSYAERTEIDYRMNKFSSENQALISFRDYVDMYPELDTALFTGFIKECEDNGVFVGRMDYSSGEGVLSVNLSTNDVTNTPKLVKALKETGRYENVTYVGYTVTEGVIDEETGFVPPDSYEFTVFCVLNVSDTRKE